MSTIHIDCIPYTCQSIVDEDIEIGTLIGYYGSKLLNYADGMVKVGLAHNPAKKGEYIEYTIK